MHDPLEGRSARSTALLILAAFGLCLIVIAVFLAMTAAGAWLARVFNII